jgi:hypothetical protein
LRSHLQASRMHPTKPPVRAERAVLSTTLHTHGTHAHGQMRARAAAGSNPTSADQNTELRNATQPERKNERKNRSDKKKEEKSDSFAH